METGCRAAPLPLRSLNHVSRVCRDVEKSTQFYKMLGFVEIKRPDSFDFEGSWLFNYGMGIHLIAGEPLPRPKEINPRADHLSFQADSISHVEARLRDMGIEYKKEFVIEAGMRVTQVFFHDPDNAMIEVCNCDCLPVQPLDASCTLSCLQAQRSPHARGARANSMPCDIPMPRQQGAPLEDITAKHTLNAAFAAAAAARTPQGSGFGAASTVVCDAGANDLPDVSFEAASTLGFGAGASNRAPCGTGENNSRTSSEMNNNNVSSSSPRHLVSNSGSSSEDELGSNHALASAHHHMAMDCSMCVKSPTTADVFNNARSHSLDGSCGSSGFDLDGDEAVPLAFD